MTADTTLVAEIRSERNSLARELALNPQKSREVVNGSGNGQSYTVQVSMTWEQRLNLLHSVLAHYESGTVPSNMAPIVIA